jgi:hypothetical protein
LEELQKEVESLRERNKLLEENYADLNILYMDRFKEESVDESLECRIITHRVGALGSLCPGEKSESVGRAVGRMGSTTGFLKEARF